MNGWMEAHVCLSLRFAQSQMSEENLFFWAEVEEFQKLTDPSELADRSRLIVEVSLCLFVCVCL